jgi:putative phosphoesterase
MKIGIFADVHDHLDNLRRAVACFNAEQVELVLFAGDLVSTIAVPPLRKLKAPLIACFGDNEGNKTGLRAGFRVIGEILEPPVRLTTHDGTRLVLAHMKTQLRGLTPDFDIAVFGHTHKPRIDGDDEGRLFLNPGETSGWTFGRPTIAILDTTARRARLLELASVNSASAATMANADIGRSNPLRT